MNTLKNKRRLLFISIGALLLPSFAYAHIKWFVAFDVSDPQKSLMDWVNNTYVINLFILSVWGVLVACVMDSFWCKRWGRFTYISDFFSGYEDITLNITRIGTGIFFVGLWLVGGTILTPDLLTDSWFVPHIQLIIAAAVLFRGTAFIAGIGILFLYSYAIYNYGIFHLLDYLTLVGLAIFLILATFKSSKLARYRLPIMYGTLVFSFLWSAIEKLAYPQWFYPFLEKYPFLTMGFDNDFFIASAAFVEFTLFFLLLMGNNGIIVVAFLSNIVITSGNIYFGKMDAIGHFPVNFILLIMLIKGPLPVKSWFFDHSCKPYSSAAVVAIVFFITIVMMVSLYYGLHWLLYQQ